MFVEMIKATELRIGNLFLEGEIDAIHYNEQMRQCEVIKNKARSFVYIDLLTPIPLTEEWLLKFGFENKAEIQPPDYFLNYVPIRFQYDVGWYDLGYDGIYHKIKFVHQLQNLYFALRGNELTIKSPLPTQ